ncbi:MAG: HupE/UreJ family protein [Novosphingobium sp.]|nr:HupE/UreJ family protein [Novosphingobium sp.]MCP5403607.1 HupE/UreJ family protein [Novosphingobium sp.]
MLASVAISTPSHAHDALPIALSLDQTGPSDYSLRARFPPAIPEMMRPQLDVAAPCKTVGRKAAIIQVRCPGERPPSAVTLAWPGAAGNAPVLLRVSYANGQSATLVSPPGAGRLELPGRQTRASVFAGYFSAGLDHIFGGADHLLFLVCLVLIARRPKRIAWTVTGFTLGHALTISLATLGLLLVDSGVVEVLIALSIVFVAAEVARGPGNSMSWRMPVLVAALFGLLHGLGFAGALREIGLPTGEVPLSLTAFNLGIEAGQLIFVVGLVLAAALARVLVGRFFSQPATRWQQPGLAAWPIGIVASLWFFERLHSL